MMNACAMASHVKSVVSIDDDSPCGKECYH